MNVLYMITQWVLILFIRIPAILLGFVIVPIGLMFSYPVVGTIQSFTKYDTDQFWELIIFPKILWLWSNARDGAMGDKRGWWNHNCSSGNSRDFLSMYQWMAIRNPVNNMRFVRGISCDVSKCIVTLLSGQESVDDKVGETGFQWLKAEGPIFNYYHLYWVKPNKKDPTRAFIVRLGHKIKISHNDNDWSTVDSNKVWKGFTFRIGFNKDIS